MSREIKFRGLTKEGKLVYGWYFKSFTSGLSFIIRDARNHSYNFTTEVIPETVGQFTGLKDKFGKDLDWWAGDLLRKGSDHSCAPIGIITYNEQKAIWAIVSKSGGEFCGLEQAYRNGWAKIGNIHQPKLMEKQ